MKRFRSFWETIYNNTSFKEAPRVQLYLLVVNYVIKGSLPHTTVAVSTASNFSHSYRVAKNSNRSISSISTIQNIFRSKDGILDILQLSFVHFCKLQMLLGFNWLIEFKMREY